MGDKTQVRYALTSDGVHIAYATVGDGFPVVAVPAWISHLELTMRQAIAFPGIQWVFFDSRGAGLSDRNLDDYSAEVRMQDVEAVVAALGLERFVILTGSAGGPISLLYAAKHRQKVAGLVLYGTFAAGALVPPDVHAAIAALIKADWGLASNTLSSLFLPGATQVEVEDFVELQREGANSRDALMLWNEAAATDVRHCLASVQCPTLVLHVRGDRVVPFEQARLLAASIPEARLVTLEGIRHTPGPAEVEQWFAAVAPFLESIKERESIVRRRQLAFRTILFTDVVSSTPLLTQLRDVKMREVMRDHDAVMEAAVTGHGGRVVKTIGDAFMAEFAVPSAAVEAAIEVQRAIREKFADSDVPVRIRIGINAGEPIEEDGDLHGASVVIAKRLESAADTNGILVSDVVKQMVTGKDFDFEDRGPVELKGFDEPVRAWAVRWA
ncbi:MAG: adenylate/guanylate cyclase domain-containing protein [Dehalococcoidia bacterium]|nr:adenylate/guanylate cyclase domain-containing protein [Dehalococcoidia bacterium]